MKKIGFVMACFNQLRLTEKCIKSIISNTPEGSYGFIFIDNGSDDGTNEFLKTVPNSETIRNEFNCYVNPAWNQGLKLFLERDFDYCGIVNNDIVVGKDWLKEVFKAFEQRHGEFYIPTSNVQPDNTFNSEQAFVNCQKELDDKPVKFYAHVEAFPGYCLLMKAEHVKFFYPIPPTLVVLRGDDWILDNLFNNGVVPTRCSHCIVHHFNGGTQRGMKDLHDIRERDVSLYTQIEKELYPKRNMKRIWEKSPFGRML